MSENKSTYGKVIKSQTLKKVFGRILDYLPQLILLVDNDGSIIYCNKACDEMFGIDSDDKKVDKLWNLFPSRDEQDFEVDKQILESGNDLSYTEKAIDKNGNQIWLDISKVVIPGDQDDSDFLILISATDVTKLRKTQYELAKEQSRLRSILENTVEGIITINRKGIIQSFNEAAENIFGYDEKEVVGKNVSMLMPSPFKEHHDSYIQNYLDTGEKKIIGLGREVRGKRKDGTVFPMELAVSEANIEGETIFTGIVRDITERRKLENEVLQISEEERIRIGQDLHDGLGQMLTGIGLISQNLARKLKSNGLPGADEIQEIADLVKEADKQAKGLAHGLVNIDLEHEGLRTALENLCLRSEKLFKISCEFKSRGNLSTENRTLSLHIYRIVQEAISNAIKHGDADHITVKCNCLENEVTITIEDNGVGISKPVNNKKIKGMGIKTMRYRAHLMGGYLDIGNSPKGGTRVSCTIPSIELKNGTNYGK